MTIAKPLAGVLILIVGLALLGWLGYNLAIEQLPVMDGRSPLPGLAIALGLIYFGIKWIRSSSGN